MTLEMIKFSHSVFALPFALIATFAAASGKPSLKHLILIVLAMVFARSAAMSFNRVADADIDKKNKRTQNRHIPKGLISQTFVLGFTFINVLGFVLVAKLLGPVTFVLSMPVLVILLFYSFTKRFTTWSHLVLGVCLGLAPVGAWVALTDNPFDIRPYFLALGVLFWVAGFDILYSLWDVEFDKKNRLFSVPSRLGVDKALVLSLIFHLISLAFILFFAIAIESGGWFKAGVVFMLLLILYQHNLVSRHDLSKLDIAFFNINGFISIGLLGFYLLDVFLK
jgi:4-hydroxybenzoate polyprenyltransferase